MRLPIDPGWVGIWLLIASLVVVVVELVVMGLWSARLVRKSRVVSQRLVAEQLHLQADAARLQASIAEMEALWQPYRRLLRWLRHPIVIALVQSYVRRRAAR